MSVDLAQVIPALVRAKVDFILIGGMAAVLHGSARVTFDVDIVYDRAEANLERLGQALRSAAPYLRDSPAGLPFKFDLATLHHGLNFTLTTKLGDLNLFGEVAGCETYNDLLPHSFDVEAFGVQFKCIDLPNLIRIKAAAGRVKDVEAIAELRALLEEQQRNH